MTAGTETRQIKIPRPRWLLAACVVLSILSGCASFQGADDADFASLVGGEPPAGEAVEPSLLLDRPVDDLPIVADFGWNHWASESTGGATVTWWLASTVLGWLAWPLTFVVFGGLRDRGYLLSRSIALLIVGYLIWLPASLHWVDNGLPLTLLAVALLVVVSGVLLWRRAAEMKAYLQGRWRVVFLGELVFGLAYLAFVGIRILNPDLWQPWRGGEKAMDVAYLNACLRSPTFPPYDPYFAHGYLNYYYYGQLLMSILVRVTGIRSTVAFNLAVPTLFALTVGNAFSIGYSLAGKVVGGPSRRERRAGFGIVHGLLAAVCVAVLGNLASATQLIECLGEADRSGFSSGIPGLGPLVRAISGAGEVLLHGAPFAGFDYWDPSRVVGPTINEFPYWSFLFADLHPHMMNIPFTLLVMALALNWLLRQAARDDTPMLVGAPSDEERDLARAPLGRMWQRFDGGQAIRWAVWPIALGALWAINSWDWPAYAGLSGLVVLIGGVQSRGRRGAVPALLAGVALAAGSLLLYLPFIRRYAAIHVGVGWGLARGHTLLGEFLTVWGFHLFLAVSFLLVLAVGQRPEWIVPRLARLATRYLARLRRLGALYGALVGRSWLEDRLPAWGGIVLSIVPVAWGAWKGYWVLALTAALLALAAMLLAQKRMSHERRFVLAVASTAFLLLVGVELFYLKDHLDGGDAWRMNTLFKFYLQVWVMLSVVGGASLPGIWRAVGRWRWGWRQLWMAVFGLLLFAASLYAILGTPARVADRMPGARPPIGTLDGLAFMQVGAYHWPDQSNRIDLRGDYEAIRWLQENVHGTPVVAEAPVWYYRDFGGRVSSYTGLPTLYNETHEGEQRYAWQTGPRQRMAHELYRAPDAEWTMALLRQLRVAYVYVGPLERSLYRGAAAKFDQLASRGLISVAYENDLVRIYRVE